MEINLLAAAFPWKSPTHFLIHQQDQNICDNLALKCWSSQMFILDDILDLRSFILDLFVGVMMFEKDGVAQMMMMNI